MKVKLDDYEIDILINGLFQQLSDYDAQTNREIEDLLLQIVQKSKHKVLRHRRKFCFTPQEARLIRMCLIEWRNQQLQAEKHGVADVISELIIYYLLAKKKDCRYKTEVLFGG